MSGDRSPNYPFISLADAVGRVKLIYERERQHAADKLVMAKALGYGSLNGLSRSVLSALVKYGLLIEEGDQLKVGPSTLDVLLHAPGSPERVAALQRAAFQPPLFSELRATFDNSLPSDDNLRAVLVKKGFNPNTVSNVIRSYRDTVLYVNQEVAQAPEAAEAPPAAGATPTKVPGAVTLFPPAAAAAPRSLELAFNLAPGRHARLILTGDVTRAEIEKLQRFLDLSHDTFPVDEVIDDTGADRDSTQLALFEGPAYLSDDVAARESISRESKQSFENRKRTGLHRG